MLIDRVLNLRNDIIHSRPVRVRHEFTLSGPLTVDLVLLEVLHTGHDHTHILVVKPGVPLAAPVRAIAADLVLSNLHASLHPFLGFGARFLKWGDGPGELAAKRLLIKA